MPMCALRIGDHVWKIESRPTREVRIIVRWNKPLGPVTARSVGNLSTRIESEDAGESFDLVFELFRINPNGVLDYVLRDIVKVS